MVNTTTADQLAETQEEVTSSWRTWLVFGLVALLVHLALLLSNFEWRASQPAPRVDLQQVDPRKLEAVKRQWRQREKQLLLSKNQPKAKEAPPEARFQSDRNIRVEKEQRARDTDVVPKPRTRAQRQQQDQTQTQAQKQSRSRTRVPNLGALGLPLDLAAEPRPRNERQQAARESRAEDEGGDQAVIDKNLPVGGENLLNAQESVFYSFYARIYEALAPVWRSRIREILYARPLNQGDYSTVVDAIFDSDGRLVAVKRLESSGIPEFDQAVDDSWRKVGRFPNPPKDLLNEQGQVHIGWTFTVQVDQRMGTQYLPPSRAY